MARHLIILAAAGLFLTGCVSGEKYNALKMEKDSAVEQLNKAQADASAARAESAAYKQQIDGLMANGTDLQKMYGLANKELAELRAQYEQLNQKYQEAISRPTTVVNLPQNLKNDLSDLARKFSHVVEFDEARGVLKFKGDVTFASGSAELTPQAQEAIRRVAQILNSPAAASYELLVSGHTDSRPVSNPAVKAAGHKDNWYLSAHRAIAVSEALMSDGVSAKRVGAAGFGAEHPIASNNSSAGMAKNRRVEVAILPTTYTGGAGAAGEEAAKPAPRKAASDLNKDTAPPAAPAGPVLNK